MARNKAVQDFLDERDEEEHAGAVAEIDRYQVEQGADGMKYVHFDGYSYELCAGEVDDPARPCRWLEGTWACADIEDGGENLKERVMLAFEGCQQYCGDLTEQECAEAELAWKSQASYLPLDEVDQNTPCGMYWY